MLKIVAASGVAMKIVIWSAPLGSGIGPGKVNVPVGAPAASKVVTACPVTAFWPSEKAWRSTYWAAGCAALPAKTSLTLMSWKAAKAGLANRSAEAASAGNRRRIVDPPCFWLASDSNEKGRSRGPLRNSEDGSRQYSRSANVLTRKAAICWRSTELSGQ